MKDSKTNVMFAVLVATLVLALASVSYTELVSAHHKPFHDKGCGVTSSGDCQDDGLGEDVDPDPDPDLKPDDPPGTCC